MRDGHRAGYRVESGHPRKSDKEDSKMKCKILCAFAVFAFAVAVTPAQSNTTTSGKCGKPDVQQSIPAGDKEGNVFALVQGKCATKGEVSGAQSKEGMYSEHQEISGNHVKVWGVYVETFESGDKIFYSYQATGTVKDGAFSGGNKYQVTGGTGKLKGIKGSGICKNTGTADGGSEYACTGEYILAGAAAKK
jgi:hypothetical protein